VRLTPLLAVGPQLGELGLALEPELPELEGGLGRELTVALDQIAVALDQLPMALDQVAPISRRNRYDSDTITCLTSV
jgi:hypothetical protein